MTHISSEDEVHEVLRRILLAGALVPGAKLAEVKLAGAFGVSRERIRKVLLRLGMERLVDLIPNRGAFVARPDPESAQEIRFARQTLESGLALRLAGNLSSDQLDELDAHVAEEEAARASSDHATLKHLSSEFHLKLVAMSSNTHIDRLMQELVARTLMLLAGFGGTTTPCSAHEHPYIVRALREGDGPRAAHYLAGHVPEFKPPSFPASKDVATLVRQTLAQHSPTSGSGARGPRKLGL